MTSTAVDNVDGKFVVLFDTGGRQSMPLCQVLKLRCDSRSWLRFLHMMMTGTPARIKIHMGGGRTATMFLVLPSQVVNGMQYEDLNSRYPEKAAEI
jgi:hypothetical protein